MQPRNSTVGSRYPVQEGPPIVQAWAATWRLLDHERQALWRSLCAAHWSIAVAWREACLRFHPEREDARAFVEQMTPTVIMDVVENLVHEGCMTRRMGSAIEGKLLQRVGRDGHWQGSVAPRPTDPGGAIRSAGGSA